MYIIYFNIILCFRKSRSINKIVFSVAVISIIFDYTYRPGTTVGEKTSEKRQPPQRPITTANKTWCQWLVSSSEI